MENRLLKNAKYLRRGQTLAENRLWYYLRGNRFQQIKFKRQKPLGIYIVDFISAKYKLIIEVDGGHHANQLYYDQRRDSWLKQQGFTVLRFWNKDIFENIEGVLTVIDTALKACPSPPAPLPQV